MKAERGKLFILEDNHGPHSRKVDGISWSRWCVYTFNGVEALLGEDDAGDAYREYGKLQLGLDYERGVSPEECARKIAGADEPIATLIKE